MFDVGDLVVCVDASPPNHGNVPDITLYRGTYYRVSYYSDLCGLLVNGERMHISGDTGQREAAWAEYRFRKIDAPDTEVSRLIRACKPVRESQPA